MKKILLSALVFIAPIYCSDSEQTKKDIAALQILKKQMEEYSQECQTIIDEWGHFCKDHNIPAASMDVLFENEDFKAAAKEVGAFVVSLIIKEHKSCKEIVEEYASNIELAQKMQKVGLLVEDIFMKHINNDLSDAQWNLIEPYFTIFLRKTFCTSILEEIEKA